MPLDRRLIAMENALFSDDAVDWDARCRAIAEAGFAGVYAVPYPLDECDFVRLRRLGEVPREHGLRVAAVYGNVDLSLPENHVWNARVKRLFEEVNGAPRVEVSFKASGEQPPDVDGAILAWLEHFVAVAERRGIDIGLYPHSFYPLESLEHARRLVRTLAHPRLGMVFATSHVYAVNSAAETVSQLETFAGEILSFNVCGCRRSAPGPRSKCVHFPLHEGDLPTGSLFAALAERNYGGDVIVQGHGWTGDAAAGLRRSAELAAGLLKRSESMDLSS